MKRNIYLIKLLLFSCLILVILATPSCKKKNIYEKMDQISYQNILSCNDYRYIVICWQVDCSNCEKLAETVEKYYNFQKKNKNVPTIYGLNVNLSYNKDIVNTTEDDYKNMIGTTNFKDIQTRTTPTILYIENGVLIKNISDFSTRLPVTEGKAWLESLMK